MSLIIFGLELITYIMNDNLWWSIIMIGFWPSFLTALYYIDLWVKKEDEEEEK